jgi:hypothetical protein
MFKKVRFGNVDFQYIETYDTEENAMKEQNSSFVEVKLGAVKDKQNPTNKAKGEIRWI